MDAPDFSDMDNENAKTPLTLLKKTWFTNYVGIIPDYRAIEISKAFDDKEFDKVADYFDDLFASEIDYDAER